MRLPASFHDLIDRLAGSHGNPADKDSFPAAGSVIGAIKFRGDLVDPFFLLGTVGEGQFQFVTGG